MTPKLDAGRPAAGKSMRPRPPARPRDEGGPADWGRRFAIALCVALAVVGLTPFAAALAVRSAAVRTWATVATERALKKQGIVATYEMSLRIWPLAVELRRLHIDSTDGGLAALDCDRLRIRPKVFALLSGVLAIDEIELDQPRARLVVKNGEVANVHVDRGPSGDARLHAPFGTFAVTDGSIDLDMEGVRVQARALDLDVTAEDDGAGGSALEVGLRVGRADVQRVRVREGGSVAADDDALCSIEARVRVQSGEVLVRRLDAVGSADLDAAPESTPSCDLPPDDKRRVELSLGNVRAVLPSADRKLPSVDGHIAVRAPIALGERAANLPETDGWVRLDADVHYGPGSILPDVNGTVEAHDVRLARYSFAQELRSEVTIRRNVVRSRETTLRLAHGTVTLSDTVFDPLAKGGKLEKTRVDAANVDFTELLRALGVHESPHVAWDIRELHAPLISGTLFPLKLDGDFTGKTYAFGIYDRPAVDHARERLFGFSEAQIAAHLAVRPEGINFMEVRATLPHSRLDGGFVSLGFDNDLRVEAPHVSADLDDISPIGPVAMHGRLQAVAHIGGTFSRPEPEGDVQSLIGLVVSDVAFGDLSAGHVKVDVAKPEIEIIGARSRLRESSYEVPTATLRFGGDRGFVVDAVGVSSAFGVRDILAMFALDADPRFYGIDATIATRSEVHIALGGPEDACGGGYIGVDAKGHLSNVRLYGERFAEGDADVSLRWHDRRQGISGADLDVRSFVLDKIAPPTGKRAGATGTVLGSAVLRRGGTLVANVMIEGVALSRVDALHGWGRELEGVVSGVAHVTGDLDESHAGAGLAARAEIDVSGTRIRGVAVPGSHLALGMTQVLAPSSPQKGAIGRTRCGAPIGAPFDKAAYLADTSAHGQFSVDGDLFGGQALLRGIQITRGKRPRASGRASIRGLDLGSIARMMAEPDGLAEQPSGARTAALGGELWGELIADDVAIDRPSTWRGRFFFGPTVVSRGGQRLVLQPPKDPLELAGDTLTTPPLEVTLVTPEGLRGGFVVSGKVAGVTTDPTLSLEARLQPVDLAVVQRLVPKVERATGIVLGSARITGRAAAPSVSGELHVHGGAIQVSGLPGALTDLQLDARATSSSSSSGSLTGVMIRGAGNFSGGTLTFDGSVPIRGLLPGALDSHVTARGVRVTPADGLAATLDADIDVTYDPRARGTESARLPHITGDVAVSSFNYTRSISLTTDLSTLGGRARRTEVNAYDPALDSVTLDLHVRSRAPFVIKNNLVEVQLGIDSGTLDVTGTNQRLGLRGVLRALPGGRFHFQQSDFEVRQGVIRFDDATRVAANVDVTAVTEYRRYTDTSAGTAAGVGAGVGAGAASIGSTRGGSLWRITLHAFGDADKLRLDMTSEPTLSQEDIVLLLAVGMTRVELDQLQASSLGASLALNYLGATSGADRAIKQALPIIDDFRFGSAYSTVTGKTEPQLTVGKRLTSDLRASVTAGLSEDRELRSNIEWRLNNRLSLQGSYDNINDVSSSTLGNLGVDLRWRLEFE